MIRNRAVTQDQQNKIPPKEDKKKIKDQRKEEKRKVKEEGRRKVKKEENKKQAPSIIDKINALHLNYIFIIFIILFIFWNVFLHILNSRHTQLIKDIDDETDYSICTLSAETEPMSLNMRGILSIFPKSIVIGLNQTKLDMPTDREMNKTITSFPSAEVNGSSSNYTSQMYGGWYWAGGPDGTEFLTASKNTSKLFMPSGNSAKFLEGNSNSLRMIIIPAIWGSIKDYNRENFEYLLLVNFTQPWRGYTNSYKQPEGGYGIVSALNYLKNTYPIHKLIMVGDTNINGRWVCDAFQHFYPNEHYINLNGTFPTVNDNEGIANIDVIAIPKSFAKYGVDFGIRYLPDGQSIQHFVAFANVRKHAPFQLTYGEDPITQQIQNRMHYLQHSGSEEWNHMCQKDYAGKLTNEMIVKGKEIGWKASTKTAKREHLLTRLKNIEARITSLEEL